MGFGFDPLRVVPVEPIFEWSAFYLDVLGTKQSIKRKPRKCWSLHIDGSVQDCSNSIASALELLQSCTNPSIYSNVPMIVAVDFLTVPIVHIGWGNDRHMSGAKPFTEPLLTYCQLDCAEQILLKF